MAYGRAGAFLTALVPVLIAYSGFQYLGQMGGEIRDAQKTIPRAAILGVSAVRSTSRPMLRPGLQDQAALNGSP